MADIPATALPVSRERQVSKKLWIRELLDGELELGDGQTQASMLKTARGPAGRINVLGVVVSKEDLPVSTLLIDDGSGQVTVRSFDQKLGQSIGVPVQVIGRPRQYQGVRYVAAEAVAVIDAGWMEFRKKELGGVLQTLEAKKVENTVVTAPGSDENKAEKIIRLIQELDGGDGAPIEMVALKSKLPEAEEIIEKLLLTGDIFELRPGKVKVL